MENLHHNHQTYSFGGIIWALKTDPLSDLLAIEVRNKETREVTFHVIDLQKGSTYPVAPPIEEKWLWGLDALENNTVFIHGFVSAQSPEHCYILAYHATSGFESWANYRYVFHRVTTEGLLAYDRQVSPKRYDLLSFMDGRILRTGVMPDAFSSRDALLLFPEPVTYEGKESLQLSFRQYHITAEIKGGGCELSIRQENKLAGQLVITDIRDLKGDLFFIFNNYLIVLKNHRELLIINL